MSNKSDRPYDIIIYGASGYTGEITAEYIATHSKNKEKWAVAGRSKDKLQALVSNLAKFDKSLASLPILTCDATKSDQIRDLVSQTRVLISCVGPYRIYGEDVVRACVEAGTDYIDVTGEPPFVNHLYDKYHAEAKDKQLYVLPGCLVPDVAVETIKEEFSKENTKTSQARGYLKMAGKYSKTFSNGTWGTLVNSLGNKEYQSLVFSFSFLEKKSLLKVRVITGGPKAGFHLFKPLSNWAYPFVEAADLHVIRRTNELTLNDAGNENFSYAQFVLIPLIPPLHVIIAILLVFLAHLFAAFSFTKKLLLKRKFADGGPTKEQRADARFDFWVYAQGESGERKTIHMQGPGAYDTTEAAFALVNDRSELKKVYGVVTPGAVMNKQMLRRLPAGGISWQFE